MTITGAICFRLLHLFRPNVERTKLSFKVSTNRTTSRHSENLDKIFGLHRPVGKFDKKQKTTTKNNKKTNKQQQQQQQQKQKQQQQTNKKTDIIPPPSPPPTHRVVGHARSCAREWACPKLQSMWTRKYGFPIPKQTVDNLVFLCSAVDEGRECELSLWCVVSFCFVFF